MTLLAFEQILQPVLTPLATQLLASGASLVCAESCTGGQISAAITAVPGSSAWFERGFVTYSNAAKQQDLGVSAYIIDKYGAVSEQTARAMAAGALAHSHANLALAVTGIAGPDGGSIDKPVGTVWFAWQSLQGPSIARVYQLSGQRHDVRWQAVELALYGALSYWLRFHEIPQ